VSIDFARFQASTSTDLWHFIIAITNTHTFEPIAYGTLGPLKSFAAVLLCELGKIFSANSGEV